ncbi:hypothetical protein MALG_00855 [Marinovum algicola DG 898]|jgi:hypothetical protein|nr:hypothetical protein MALG_00855 [Marinovum algicola DG 898]
MIQPSFPEYLKQGEPARLFPVLSTTSKEGRTTSIVLACISKVQEFGADLLNSLGQRVGVRAQIDTFTEIVFENQVKPIKDRPDGLLVLRVGRREWRALLETKIGTNELNAEQIEKYRLLAKENKIDCVITISNQFATSPSSHPLDEVRRSRSKIPVFHWSWMHILTTADLLITQDGVEDSDQRILLNELIRFLTHESAGVRGFDRMPREWSELNKIVSSGGGIPVKSPLSQVVLEAWHQETRDLALILSRLTGATVIEKLPKRHRGNPGERLKDELQSLKETHSLYSFLEVPDAAAPLEVCADLLRRTVDIGMTIRAPEDKVSTKARVNWLLRQLKTATLEDVHIRLCWPGKSDPTQYPAKELIENVEIASTDKAHLSPHSFVVFVSRRFGARFTQQVNFIADLEALVPQYYDQIGSKLVAWSKPAPKLRDDRKSGEDVSTEALAEDAERYET